MSLNPSGKLWYQDRPNFEFVNTSARYRGALLNGSEVQKYSEDDFVKVDADWKNVALKVMTVAIVGGALITAGVFCGMSAYDLVHHACQVGDISLSDCFKFMALATAAGGFGMSAMVSLEWAKEMHMFEDTTESTSDAIKEYLKKSLMSTLWVTGSAVTPFGIAYILELGAHGLAMREEKSCL